MFVGFALGWMGGHFDRPECNAAPLLTWWRSRVTQRRELQRFDGVAEVVSRVLIGARSFVLNPEAVALRLG